MAETSRTTKRRNTNEARDVAPSRDTRLTFLIIGPNAAGKSSCARYLASLLNGVVIEFGEEVRRKIESDASLARDPSKAYEELLRRHGSVLLTRWARAALAACDDTQAFIMVGARDEPAYRYLLAEFPSVIRVAVTADQRVRRAREASRLVGRSGEVASEAAAFEARDALHKQWGLDILLREAHYTVQNNGSLDELKEHLDLLISRIAAEGYHVRVKPTS